MGWLTKTTTLSDFENTWVYNLETIQVEDSVIIQKDQVHSFIEYCHSEILKLIESKYLILKRALGSHQFYVYSTQDYDRGEIKIVDSERKIVTVNIYFSLDTIVLNCFSGLESIPTMRRVDELSFSGFHNICNYLKLIFDKVEDIYSKDYKTKCIIALEELRSYFSGTIDLDLHFIHNVSGIQELLLCGDKNCYFYLRVKFLSGSGDTQLSYSLDPEYHKLKGDEEDYTKDIVSDCKSLNIDQWYRLLMQKITWITTKV